MDCLEKSIKKLYNEQEVISVKPIYAIVSKKVYEKIFKNDVKNLLEELDWGWCWDADDRLCTFFIKDESPCDTPIRKIGEMSKKEVINFIRERKKEFIEKEILENIKYDNFSRISFNIKYPPIVSVFEPITPSHCAEENYPIYDNKSIEEHILKEDDKRFILFESAYIIK